jgi:hypothetical protein
MCVLFMSVSCRGWCDDIAFLDVHGCSLVSVKVIPVMTMFIMIDCSHTLVGAAMYVMQCMGLYLLSELHVHVHVQMYVSY